MIKVRDLKEGDVVEMVDNGRKFTVVSNKIDDCIHFYDSSTSDDYKGFHLFYDDIEDAEYGEMYLNLSFD